MMHFPSPFPGLLAEAFVAGLWQSAALLAATGLVSRLLPKAGAAARHLLLLGTFLLLAVLPWVHLPVAAAGHRAAAVHALPWLAEAVAAVWLLAMAVRGAQLWGAWRHLRTLAAESTALPWPGSQVQAMLATPLGKRRVLLCSSQQVDSPAMLGFLRPRLLLPAWVVPTLAPEDLEKIALHECEHLRRGDDWVNLLQQLALVLLPLHPGLVWLNRRLELERELACDAGVVARGVAPLAYARCLTSLAEQRREQRGRLRLALAALARRSQLAQRVHALLEVTSGFSPARSRLAAGFAATALLGSALAVARVPVLVSFSGVAATAPKQDVASVRLPETSVASGIVPVALHPGLAPLAANVHQAVFRLPLTTHGAGLRQARKHAQVHTLVAGATALPIVSREARASVQLIATGAPASNVSAGGMSLPAVLLARKNVARPERAAMPAARGTSAPARLPDGGAPRAVLITTDFVTSYAAVPFGDGWLVIQL